MLLRCQALQYQLLIEPVWNQNANASAASSSIGALLIEPVWNQNLLIGWLSKTSVGLLIEPVWNQNCLSGNGNLSTSQSFNRTSLESKHATTYQILLALIQLLIEPVWNRNIFVPRNHTGRMRLLIEPVWNQNMCLASSGNGSCISFNRTSLESKLRAICYVYVVVLDTFNRTSLESKLSFKRRCISYCRLLIEPVWNQNSLYAAAASFQTWECF